MAKGKNLNPADAYRKSLRKKELKKNKAERSKARDFALVKKDTRDLEDDIQKLGTAAELSASDQARLADLKSELENINKKKAEYVQEHPEQRKLVYRPRRQEKDGEKQEELVLPKRNLFNARGLPRHPERSIYYDPIMNPFGVAPPGMPYMERPLQPGEVDSEYEEEDDEDDEDIPMPPGPPPGTHDNGDSGDSDDDIPMPEGPPPNRAFEVAPPVPSQTPGAPPPPTMPPFPPQLPILESPLALNAGFAPQYIPPPPPLLYLIPPPPPPPPLHLMPPPPPPLMSPPPPGIFSNSTPRAASTFKSTTPSKTIIEAATVFAAPQLRDFKKEATAFVPTSIKRKNTKAASSTSRINAAPSVGDSGSVDEEPSLSPSKPDLLGALKEQFGRPASGRPVGNSKGGDKKDDYAKFVEEMDDILGPVV